MTVLKPNNEVSSMRAAMLICVLTGCVVALMGVWRGVDLVGLGVLVASLIAPVVGGKVWQKGKE